jgi:uncharacterized membrane protein
MTTKRAVDALPILGTAVLGLIYVFFFAGKDSVLLVIFGLQTLRCGLALRLSAKER